MILILWLAFDLAENGDVEADLAAGSGFTTGALVRPGIPHRARTFPSTQSFRARIHGRAMRSRAAYLPDASSDPASRLNLLAG